MKTKLQRKWIDVWYKDPFIGAWLSPLSFLFLDFARFRRFLYHINIKKSRKLPVPVVVVGNITVGGTGKTPLCIYLANLLEKNGYRVGIISLGYGGNNTTPQFVTLQSNPLEVGDEAILLVKKTQCPVVVAPSRFEAGEFLLKHHSCDIVLSDDGLQHYALKRDIEIAVIDGERRFGNGYCLPAGPLREPIERLNEVNFVVVNGKNSTETPWTEWEMSLQGDVAINLVTGEEKKLSEFKMLDCHAVAGIGHPERFFKQLEKAGLRCVNHGFPDHYVFKASDLDFKSDTILMTEKDAVKCQNFATIQHWYVPVSTELNPRFDAQFLRLLQK